MDSELPSYMKAIIVMIASTCLRRMALIAIAGCLTAAGVQGQFVLFSNLTTVNKGDVEIIGGSVTTGPPTTWAANFIVKGTFNLVDAKVSVAAGTGDPTFNVFIANSFQGSVDRLIRWRQIGFGLKAPSGGGVLTANSVAAPITLVSGSEYWLVLAAANPQSRFRPLCVA